MIKKIKAVIGRKDYLADLLLILFFGLHVFIGQKSGLLYIGGDTGIPMTPIKNLDLFNLWQNHEGGVLGLNLGNLLQFIFFAFFEYLGLGLVATQRIYIYLAHTLAGLFMYYLVRSFSDSRKGLAPLIASLFYMFSPWLLNYLGIFVFLPYTVIPLILGLFVRGLNGTVSFYGSILAIVVSFLGILINFPQYSMFFVAASFMFLYLLFYLLILRGSVSQSIKYCLCLAVMMALSYAWLYLPYMTFFTGSGVMGELETKVKISSSVFEFGDFNYSTIVHLIRMFGAAGFMSGGATYSQPYLTSPILILISYAVPLLVFSALILKKKSKSVLFFSLAAIFFIFLAKGVNAPFGRLHFELVARFPIARAFRTTWNLSLGANIAFAFLLGVVAEELSKKFAKKKVSYFWTTTTVILTLILINGWPLITGSYFQFKWNPPSFDGVKVPEAYFNLRDFLSSTHEDNRFFRLPQSGGMLKTNWGYFGSDFYVTLFSSPFISGHPWGGSANELIGGLYQRITDNYQPAEAVLRITSLLNIKRILVDNYDERWGLKTGADNYFTKFGTLEKKEGDLRLNVLDENYYLPHFYIPEKLIFTNVKPADFVQVSSLPGWEPKTAIINLDLIGEKKLDYFQNRDIVVKASSDISLEKEFLKQKSLSNIDVKGIYFPPSRWKPGTFAHNLGLKREAIDLSLSKRNPEGLFEKSLFFASKRIFEIGKFGEAMTADRWGQAINNYQEMMRNCFAVVKSPEIKANGDLTINFLVKLQTAIIAHNQKLEGLFPYSRRDLQFKVVESQMFAEFEKEIEELNSIPNLFERDYTLKLPQSGSYQLYLKEDSPLFENLLASGKIKAYAVNKAQELAPIAGMNWFSEGDYKIKLITNSLNFLSDKNWQYDADPLYEEDRGEMVFHFRQPFATDKLPVAYQEIANFSPQTYYQLDFDYSAKGGRVGFAIIQDVDTNPKTNQVTPLLVRFLPKTDDDKFVHFSTVFKSSRDSREAKIYLFTEAREGKFDTINFRGLRLQPTFESLVFMVQQEPFSRIGESANAPEISFQKINSTKYKLQIKGSEKPALIIFSEGFHNQWKMSDPKRPKAIFDHYLANGYANSWLVYPGEFSIELGSQSKLYQGIAISLASIGIFILSWLAKVVIFKK